MGLGAAGGVRRDGPQVPGDPPRLELVRELSVDLARSPVRHGVGAFETLRVANGRPLLLRRHLARLSGALAELSLPGLPPEDAVRAAVAAAAAALPNRDGVARLVAAEDRLLVTAAPPPAPLAPPVRIALSTRVRRLAGAPTTRFKALSYLDNVLLAREAAARGLFDAIAPNERGGLADGGRCNLFIVIDGAVLTPRAAADGALPGVVRGVLLEAGIAREAALAPADLGRAEALFVTNSVIGMTVVSAADGTSARVTSAAADDALGRAREAYAAACAAP